ncbi:hypothetical protein ACQPZG_04545 (plasmid) [Streptomyces sp. CA-294286]|uniref:hypothetical protein n=1 Tax=Streptomyces sp. CA-294286 TaxID=3240070 RepID=UPI003D906DD7
MDAGGGSRARGSRPHPPAAAPDRAGCREAEVDRTYTRDSDGTIVYCDIVTEPTHGQVASRTGWSDQTYHRYDATGRLTTVADTWNTQRTRRGCTSDARPNRRNLTASTGTLARNLSRSRCVLASD